MPFIKIFQGALVLDLFAGSGALGLEALSRGAREALFRRFVPGSLSSHSTDNIELSKPKGKAFCKDYQEALKDFKAKISVLTSSFLDPPYAR
jgi:16S rRNA (guanine966-N2)-methyltransferase